MGAPWWIVTALLFCCALVQASLIPSLGFVAVRPDFVLQCVVMWAVMRGVREALPWAFAGGLLLDLFSAGPFGTAALAMVLVAFCSSAGQFSVFRSNVLLPVLIVFFASLLYGVIYLFLLRTHQLPVDWLGALRETVLPNAVVNTVLAPLTYAVLVRLERRTRATVAVDW
jgi:rod shape-determining protein MreD